jgi:hypothetical protein
VTFASERARLTWARTRVQVSPDRYVLASLPRRLAAAAVAGLRTGDPFVAVVVEPDEVSLTVSETSWAEHPLRATARTASPAWRVLTLDVELPLDLTGFLAPAAAALAEAGVPIVPQCAYSRDHVLVPDDRLDAALAALRGLIEEAGATGG